MDDDSHKQIYFRRKRDLHPSVLSAILSESLAAWLIL
jgi:hypothetical protein